VDGDVVDLDTAVDYCTDPDGLPVWSETRQLVDVTAFVVC
jgi:hypothetical protein